MAKRGNKNRKARYDAYKNSGRKAINKHNRKLKAEKREQKFVKRREEGKAYTYVPPKTDEERYDRSFKNVDRRLPYQKLTSIFAKLNNELARKELERKERRK